MLKNYVKTIIHGHFSSAWYGSSLSPPPKFEKKETIWSDISNVLPHAWDIIKEVITDNLDFSW